MTTSAQMRGGTTVRASIATIGALVLGLSGAFSVGLYPSAAVRLYVAVGLALTAFSAWTLVAATRAGRTNQALIDRSRTAYIVAERWAIATVVVGPAAGLVAAVGWGDWEAFGFFLAETLLLGLLALALTFRFRQVIERAAAHPDTKSLHR